MGEMVVMSVNYKEFQDFTKKIEQLGQNQKDEFMEACCKELAARLLQKVIKRTPVGVYEHKTGGTLRRGWTAETHEEAASGSGAGKDANKYVDSLKIEHIGNGYKVEVKNPVEYAIYVEYGHRTRDHQGWVPGRFMLTVSEKELQQSAPGMLEKKLKKYMEDVFQ